jgi:ubiquinone/menaquinone biosynthesis C-methylase UbiE
MIDGLQPQAGSKTMVGIWSNVDASANPRDAAIWAEQMAGWQTCREYKKRTVELMALKAGACALDLGCGPGADLLLLQNAVGSSGLVCGVDSSTAMISYAAEKIGSGKPGLELKVADAHALPFDDDTFDGVRADRVFQHLPEPYTALKELVRVTKSGGNIVVVDPDQDTLVIAVDAGEVTTLLRDYRKTHAENPTFARDAARLLADLGAKPSHIEAFTLVLTDPAMTFGLTEWPEMLYADSKLTKDQLSRWQSALDRALKDKSFFYAVTLFVTCAKKS